jgi:hypothetical protein
LPPDSIAPALSMRNGASVPGIGRSDAKTKYVPSTDMAVSKSVQRPEKGATTGFDHTEPSCLDRSTVIPSADLRLNSTKDEEGENVGAKLLPAAEIMCSFIDFWTKG